MKETDPIISIVIPVYNGQEYLERCIESVINQSYSHLEILCVDDGSTDATNEILKKYQSKDSRVRMFRTPNKGVSLARNHALRQINGDYVMFVDGDDWIDTDICETALTVALDYNADLVFWSYTREYVGVSRVKSVMGTEKKIYDRSGVLQLRRRLFGLIEEEVKEPDKGNSLVPVWGKLYRRDVIGDTEFIDIRSLGTGEDILFNIDVFAKIKSAVYIPSYAYHYRRYNSDSITTQYNPKMFDMWQHLYIQMQKRIEYEGLENEYLQALSNRRAFGLIALGQNVLASGKGIHSQIADFKEILADERYSTAFEKLNTTDMPLHWKLFFRFAYRKNAVGVYFLSKIIQKIRGK